MAIRKRDEIIESVRTRLGEAPDDDGMTLLEDLTDTFDDYDTRANVNIDEERRAWEVERENLMNQIAEVDRTWRTKYAERFSKSAETDSTEFETQEDFEETNKDIKIDDLFE